jgi:hypothetical protein
MVSGSFDADNLSFGGSYFQYVQIQGGDTIPRYTWRINTGKIQIEENGNILMAGNFYNKKHYTITYTNPGANVEDITTEEKIVKLMRDGQIIIRKGNQEFTILGNTL